MPPSHHVCRALAAAALAACGGAPPPAPAPPATPPAPEAAPPVAAPAPPIAAPDPQLAARQAFKNAGGMWMPAQMTLPGHVEAFQRLGVAMGAEVLADPLAAPLAAVVSIGGCTASFVSPQGLLVTNHHCVQGALQLNSTPQENLVESGFLAKTRADERTAGPAQRVLVAQAFKDVTTEVRRGLAAIRDPRARTKEREQRQKALIAACEKDRPGLRCQVSSFFRGAQYLLIENLEIRDVRLVYVPARSVGNYGGEVDNWAWPRHTGDFAFYRAYVGPDGKPADFSKANVPFRPKHHLKVSAEGVRPADFVMVTGYPGVTSRTDTALETRHEIEWGLPYQIALLKAQYELAEQHLKVPGETAIKASVLKQGVQNGLEASEGVLKGLTAGNLLQRKLELDAKIQAWAAEPGRAAHQQALARLAQILTAQQRRARGDFDQAQALFSSRLLGTALTLTRWAEERGKPDGERKPGFQDRDLPRAVARQKQFAKQYDRALDRALVRLALVRALEAPAAERAWLPVLLGAPAGAPIDAARIDRALDGWYAAHALEDEATRLDLLQRGTPAQLKASRDPVMQAAQRLWPRLQAEERRDEAEAGELAELMPMYVEALRAVLGGQLAPDANSTLRITYGTVTPAKRGRGADDAPQTVGSQILAKDTGKEPFDAPKALLDALRAKRFGRYADPALGGELPVNFLSDLDITGGNSGSPTLNRRGELVGLAFDGTIEGVSSDVVYEQDRQRTIHVDARYMLWVMDALDGADHLIRELGLEPQL